MNDFISNVNIIALVGLIIPIVAVVGIVFIAITAIVKGAETKQKRYEVMKSSIESGKELPPDFFKGKQQSKEKMLRQGTFFTMFGVGLLLPYFLGDMEDIMDGLFPFSFVFIALGIGFLITYFVEKAGQKKQGDE